MSGEASGFFDRARKLLLGKKPAEQLAEIREQIAAAEAEIQRCDGEIKRLAMAVMMRDQDAVKVCADLTRQKQQTEAELSTMRNAEASCVAAVRAEEETARRDAAAALPEKVAATNAATLEVDDQIDALAEQLAAAFKRRLELGRELAELVGSQTLARVNQVVPHRIRSAIANKFRLDLEQPNSVAGNNLLDLRSDEVGDRAWMSLRQLDQENLDDEAPYYRTADEAEAARERQAKRGMAAAVVPIGRCFTVERQDHMFTDQATAEATVQAAARVGRDLVVVPHGPGWLVQARRFADAAIASAAD
jgi:hypothetical protein